MDLTCPMNNSALDLILTGLKIPVYRKTTVHGSLVDCVVNAFNVEYLILERHKAQEEDVLYLHSIKNDGARKYIVTEVAPEDDVYMIASRLDVRVFTENQVSPSMFGFLAGDKSNDKDIIALADKFASLKTGPRLFLIMSAGWREAVIIFSIGFSCALILGERLLPFVKSALQFK